MLLRVRLWCAPSLLLTDWLDFDPTGVNRQPDEESPPWHVGPRQAMIGAFLYVVVICFTSGILLQVVRRYEPNRRLAFVLEFLVSVVLFAAVVHQVSGLR